MTALVALAEWALKNWKLVAGGLALTVLGIMLFLARSDAAHWRKQDAADVAALNLEVAKHAVTRQSLEQAIAAINDQNAAVEKLKAESDTRTAAASKALADAHKAAESAEASAKALEASAGKSRPAGSCAPSAAYLAVKGQL